MQLTVKNIKIGKFRLHVHTPALVYMKFSLFRSTLCLPKNDLARYIISTYVNRFFKHFGKNAPDRVSYQTVKYFPSYLIIFYTIWAID